MKIRNSLIIASAVFCMGLLLSVDYQRAFAYSITDYDNGGSNASGITIVDNYIAISTDIDDSVKFYSLSSPTTLVATVTGCNDCYELLTYNDNVYARGLTAIYEISPTVGGSFVLSNTLSTTSACKFTPQSLDTATGILYCARQSTTDDYLGIDLDTMTTVFDSATLNAGGTPCNDPTYPVIDKTDNWIMFQCSAGTARLNTYTIQDVTVLHSLATSSLMSAFSLAVDVAENNIVHCPDFCDMLEYTTAGGFVSVSINIAGTNDYRIPVFDSQGKRIIVKEIGPGENNYIGLDSTNGTLLFSISQPLSATVSNNIQSYVVSSVQMWSTNGQSVDTFSKIDMTGLDTGTGGTTPDTPSDPNAEFCSLPENANILICRLDNGGGLTGSSNLINQSGTNIICQIGLLQCTQDEDGNFTPDNPDIQTNGVGYLLLMILMGVFVGILWVASRGDLTSIPTFIWFIGAIMVMGATTALGWVDPTFLIIGIITVVALAVAKARNVFGGNTMFSGEGN